MPEIKMRKISNQDIGNGGPGGAGLGVEMAPGKRSVEQGRGHRAHWGPMRELAPFLGPIAVGERIPPPEIWALQHRGSGRVLHGAGCSLIAGIARVTSSSPGPLFLTVGLPAAWLVVLVTGAGHLSGDMAQQRVLGSLSDQCKLSLLEKQQQVVRRANKGPEG
ncbi:hypothetical protein BT96DRAFT_1008371 [Gymnopus androsaceus JB14]|uniref:Uncharacterized protein n=1 Tax=Gymnopus androsaceus JB14 TaxID=1447944 RepID=A0A6A4GFD6_9AGAR|nr:hypothetical protein BT96DRAFT_1008371 [Gymnopus androsaceus JB14]